MSTASSLTMRQAALRIVRTLREAGYTALFAGGCVRDMLMRRRADDFDIATDATPDVLLKLFRRTQKVGVQFGVVIVGVGPHWIEVATFRSDLAYADGRHPSGVQFSTPQEDAARRDFTINGMFYDPIRRRVIDYVGGQRDLKQRVVRAIGEPAERFAEDHLRLLRAIRFAARFGFRIEPRTAEALAGSAPGIRRVSAERVCDELDRILAHPSRAEAWRSLERHGLLPHLWSTADRLVPHVGETVRVLSDLPRRISFALGLAAVLLPMGAADVGASCAALRTSNEIRKAVMWFCSSLPRVLDPHALTLADLKLLMARGSMDDLLALAGAVHRARRQSLEAHRRLMRRVASILPNRVAPPPLVTGTDLSDWNIPAGPIYRTVLERVYYAQLNGDVCDRAAALGMARRLLGLDARSLR